MKRMMTVAMGALLCGSFAFAADAEKKMESSETTGSNMSGEPTTTKKTSKKTKDAAGTKKESTKEKTTVHSDGTADHSSKTETTHSH